MPDAAVWVLQEVDAEGCVAAIASRSMRVSIAIIAGQQMVNSAQKPFALAANLGANSIGRIAAQVVVKDFALKEPLASFREYVAQNGFD